VIKKQAFTPYSLNNVQSNIVIKRVSAFDIIHRIMIMCTTLVIIAD